MKSAIHLNTNLQLLDFLHLVGPNWILKKKKEQEVSNEIEILWTHMKSGINDVSMNDDETYQIRRETRRRERRRPSLQQRNPFLRSLQSQCLECFWWVSLLLALKSCFYWSWTRRCNSLALRGSQWMHIYFWSTTLQLRKCCNNLFFLFPITYRPSLCNLINLVRTFL